MFIGKVTGTVVSTQKVDTVVGRKLLLVQALSVEGDPPQSLKSTGRTAVAIDTVGAGEGQIVLVTQRSSARLTEITNKVPADAGVIGIIDSIQAKAKEIFISQDQGIIPIYYYTNIDLIDTSVWGGWNATILDWQPPKFIYKK